MKDFIVLKTFQIQWINHPVLKLKTQYFAEDILYEDITSDLQSFAIAEDLDYNESMIHFLQWEGVACIITRSSDLKVPITEY